MVRNLPRCQHEIFSQDNTFYSFCVLYITPTAFTRSRDYSYVTAYVISIFTYLITRVIFILHTIDQSVTIELIIKLLKFISSATTNVLSRGEKRLIFLF